MDSRYILLLLLFCQVAFSATDCAGYEDSFFVRVLDGALKPVPGADVTVTYDRGATFGEKYFTTPINQTDSSGKRYYEIINLGTTSREIDCNIVINASAGGARKSVKIIADQHGPTVDVKFDDVFLLRFYVRDQLKAPLKDAAVSIGNFSGRTDQNGKLSGYFKVGSYDYFASYIDASQAGKLNVSNETDFEVIFPHYRISIDVTDDSGKPLDAELSIFNQTFQMENGHFENEKTFGETVPYRVEYGGLVTEDTILPATNPIVMVRYDISSPTFKSITPAVLNNRYKLNVEVFDPNQYPSGIDVSSVKVRYKIEPSDATSPWGSAIVYTTGRSMYTADFPELPGSSIVKFVVEVKDKAGNRAEKEGTFSTFAGAINGTQNQTEPQPNPSEDQGIPLIYIAVGAIVLVLAAILVFIMKSKAAGG